MTTLVPPHCLLSIRSNLPLLSGAIHHDLCLDGRCRRRIVARPCPITAHLKAASHQRGRSAMSETSSSHSRRSVLVTAAALGAISAFPAAVRAVAGDAIRPFHIDVPEEEV